MEVICYRCGGGEAPENSITGIENCRRINPNWKIEMDLQLTRDNHIVLLHDNSLKRTYGPDTLISKIDLKGLKGYKVPTLVEVLEEYPSQHWVLDVHSSDPRIVTRLISIIEKFGIAMQCTIVSESDEVIRSIRKQRPSWIVAAGTNEAKKIVGLNKLGFGRWAHFNSDILGIPEMTNKLSILNSRLVRNAHARKKKVWIFGKELNEILKERSMNLPISSQRYSQEKISNYKKLGVDGIFTDFPQYIKDLLANNYE